MLICVHILLRIPVLRMSVKYVHSYVCMFVHIHVCMSIELMLHMFTLWLSLY